MNTGITVNGSVVKVGNKTVANITGDDSWETLADALLSVLRKDEAVYLAVHLLTTMYDEGRDRGGVRTSDVANFLDMDRSNCAKALERLLDDGRIRIVGSTDDKERGRPSRLWAI